MPNRYRQPKNEDDFEEFCLVLLREHWSLPTLDRYARRGEGQDGIDLLDTGGDVPVRAVQCKHHDQNKTLPPKELAEEVEKAKGAREKIGEYYVLTTAKKSARTQLRVREINNAHIAAGLFVVRLLTWDDIERILDECPNAQEFLGVQAPQAMRRLLRAELQPIHTAFQSQGDNVHSADLDEVKRELDGGQILFATRLLQKLRKNSWDQLSPRTRCRWCTLFADAELRQGNDARAAQLLIEAGTCQPDDDGAISNKIMAYEILGNRSKAFELAMVEIDKRPHSGAIYATAIRTSPSYTEFSRLFDNIPEHLRDNGEIWVAAATREDPEMQAEQAEAIARRATTLASDDARGWFALAGRLIRSELEKVDPEGAPGAGVPVRRRVEEARDCCTKVVDLSKARGIGGFAASALIRRATARAYLGDTLNAHRDIEEARHLAPTDPGVLVAAARMDAERGNHAEGVQLLRQVVMRKEDDEACVLLGIALWNKNDLGDRVEAVELLARVGVKGKVHVEPANELAVEGMVIQGRFDDALAHLRDAEARLDASMVATARARVEAARGSAEAASIHATEALAKLSNRTSQGTLRKLGQLLVSLGRLADALPLWERLIIAGEVNDDARRFVDCAGRLGRHADVLNVCAVARNAGIFDAGLLEWELRLLDRYDPDTALTVLQEFVRREPANQGALIHLVNLALRQGNTAIAAAYASQIPPVTDVEAEEGAAVVAVLGELNKPNEAVAYAYDLLRRHFNDHRAHRAFRDAMINRHRDSEPEAPTEVRPGVAVCLVEDHCVSPQWFVLEDSSVPAAGVQQEIALDSSLAGRLIGKKVGDQVALSEGPGITRMTTVRELLPKLVYRVRDVWERWQYRFPDHQEMWMVRVAAPGDDKTADLSALFELAEEQHRRQKEAQRLYTESAIPVWLFGQAIGTAELYAFAHVAEADNMSLRCCAGTAEEYAAAVTAMKASSEVVLDISALATLAMLNELGVLELLGKASIITPATMASIRAHTADARLRIDSEGAMGADESGPSLFVTPPEGRQAALAATERFQSAVQKCCRVVGCAVLADIEAADRTLLDQGIGPSSLESACLGSAAGRTVWTDDGVVALIAREKFGARRVWTQAVLRWLNEQGILSSARYADASARLLGWQYSFTSVNPQVMRAAANQSEWNPGRRPLKQAIAYLALDSVRTQDAALLGAFLVAYCYRDAVLPGTRCSVLLGASESLARRSDFERGLLLFESLLPRVFGLNAGGQHDAMQTFRAWRAEHLRRLSTAKGLP